MSETLENLEKTLDRQMVAIADRLNAPDPSPECLERVTATVTREAARLRQHDRRLRTTRSLLGVAAAIVLVVVLGRLPASAPTVDVVDADPTQWLSDWTAAVEASSQQVTMLLTEEYWPNSWQTDDDEQALDELLDSLEQSENLLLGA